MGRLASAAATALAARAPLLASLHAERTDCYRLFHGAVEGLPGLTLDRYGDLLLLQSFREPGVELVQEELELVRNTVAQAIPHVDFTPVYWVDRRRGASGGNSPPLLPEHHHVHEMGVRYLIEAPAQGRDPWLYLDFRTARRWLLRNSAGCDVLNVFSYTCGAGIACLIGGAREVLNVDFSESALEIGRRNALLNDLIVRDRRDPSATKIGPSISCAPSIAGAPGSARGVFTTLRADAVPALRAFAGLQSSPDRRRSDRLGRGGAQGHRGQQGRGRGRRGAIRSPHLLQDDGFGISKPTFGRKFDLIVLDPPTWATSASGMTVDLVRDYQSLFKPSILALKPGGTVLATNHVSTVDMDEWLGSLERCAAKAGVELKSLTTLTPENDFPSPDGKHPLKIVLATIA